MQAYGEDQCVLDADGVHRRLVEDKEHISAMANIPVAMLYRSATQYCGQSELNWLAAYFEHLQKGLFGAYTLGEQKPNAGIKFQAMTAVMLRNFIDARIVTLASLVEEKSSGNVSNPTVLYVPNFHAVTHGKPLTGWQVQLLYDVLLERMTLGRMTVLYIASFEQMAQHYGPSIAALLQDHYVEIKSHVVKIAKEAVSN